MESDQISNQTKSQLKAIYDRLNPAELKRKIDSKIELLYKTYKAKNLSQSIVPMKKITPRIQHFSVKSYVAQQPAFRLGV